MSGNNNGRRGADLGPRHRSIESEADKARRRAKKDQEVNAAKEKLIADNNDAKRRFAALLSSSTKNSSTKNSSSSSSGSNSISIHVNKEDYSCSRCDKKFQTFTEL